MNQPPVSLPRLIEDEDTEPGLLNTGRIHRALTPLREEAQSSQQATIHAADEMARFTREIREQMPLPRNQRLLLVDDERLFLVALMNGLAGEGFEIDIAADPTTAKILARHRLYDAAVVDFHLNGTRGDELVRQLRDTSMAAPLRAKRPAMPIIIITGDDRLNLDEVVQACGATKGIHKPFAVSQLVELLDRFIPIGESVVI